MKYIKYLLIIISLVLITGCNNNGSPESVAKEMAKRLSNGNYKNIEELLLTEKDVFLDEKVFKEYLDNNNIKMLGNKKIEVLKDNTNNENSNNKLVKIKIDNDYVLNINTTKVNGKWYIDIGNNFINNFKITVPANATVKLNGKELSKKYKEKSNEQQELQCLGLCEYASNLNINVNTDVYVIPQILNGTYKLTVDGQKGHYETERRPSEFPLKIYLEPTSKYQSSIKKYIENSIQDIFTSIENDKKDNIKKYYHEKILDSVMKDYNKISAVDNNYTTFVIYYKDIKLESLSIKSMYVFGNTIIVNGTYDYSFTKEQTYIKYLSGTHSNKINRSYKFTLQLEENSDNNFKIVQGSSSIIFARGLY